jgi:uncharacterized membrane protein YfcA
VIEIVALIVIGVVAGLLAGLLGIGGGLVIVPSLTWLLAARGAGSDVAVPMAVATSLGTMLLTSAASAASHWRRANVDWPAVARLGPAIAVGALFGAAIAARIPGDWLARVFALLTALIALHMLVGGAHVTRPVPARVRGGLTAGPAIGALSAMIGIGGGSFSVPFLTWNGYSTLKAVGIAAACGWPIAAAGSAAFLVAGWGRVEWPGSIGFWYVPGVVVIGICGSLAAPLGARLAHRLGSAGLARAFGVFLLVVALRMAL